MKNRRIHIIRFPVITALALIGCYIGLTERRPAVADSTKNVAKPLPALRGETAVYPVTIDPTLAQQTKLTASDAAGLDDFGTSVTISGDTAVVGAPGDDTAAGSDAGSVYVFVRSGSGWSQLQQLTASDAAEGDRFGDSVAISGDTIVVGAPFDDTAGADAGSAYVFVRSGSGWSQQAKLTASEAAEGDRFGTSAAISGETVVVGAPFDDTAGGSDAGSAYVFVRSGTSWSQLQQLTPSDTFQFDNFGFAVATNGDTTVVGSRFDDTAAGTNTGSAWVFVRSGTSWSEQQQLIASDAADVDGFGDSVGISGDTVVVACPHCDTAAGTDAGAAYVFVRSGSNWSQQQKLTASDGAVDDLFGIRVAISGDTIVASAPFADTAGTDAGSAYVFVRSGSSWSQQQKLTASDAAAGDTFGAFVAISGETVVIGAPFDDSTVGANAGSAYVFASLAPTNRPPDCSGANPSVSSIWPPNHSFVNVSIRGVTDPDGDAVSITINQIKQDEETDGTGDGHTCPDGQGIGTSTAQIRAERSASLLGGGDGRVYTIFFTASDGKGGSGQGSVTVGVPRTNGGSAINGGAIFDSTECSGFSGGQFCLLGVLLHLLGDPLCLP